MGQLFSQDNTAEENTEPNAMKRAHSTTPKHRGSAGVKKRRSETDKEKGKDVEEKKDHSSTSDKSAKVAPFASIGILKNGNIF